MRLEVVGILARFFAKRILPSFRYLSVFIGLISLFVLLVVISGNQVLLAWTGATYESMASTAALALGGALSMLYFYHNSYYKLYTDINFSQEKQIEKIRDLIARVDNSLMIYAGEFNSSVYEDQRIVTELKRLPKDCDIKLFFEEPQIDKRSKKFLDFCKSRGITPLRVEKTSQGHFAVADRTHVRLEFSKSNHDTPQYASYHYWRPDFADHVLARFRANVTGCQPDIELRELPQ